MHDVFGHGVVLEYAAPFELVVRFDDVRAGDRRIHLAFAPVTIHRDGKEINFRSVLPEETFGEDASSENSGPPIATTVSDDSIDALIRLAETGNSLAMLRLGEHFQLAGDDEVALEWYERSSALGNAEAARVVGRVAMDAGDQPTARESWKAAAAGGNTWAMKDLGDLARQAGDIAEATSWFVQAAEGGNAWAMKDLGDLADQRGDESTAREWWLRAVDADFSDNGLSPSSAEVALRQLAERTGDLELLARLEDVRAMVTLGDQALKDGRVDAARSWFEKAADVDPEWGVPCLRLGQVAELEGRPSSARTWYERAVAAECEEAVMALEKVDREALGHE
jgi:TPR repeat protein